MGNVKSHRSHCVTNIPSVSCQMNETEKLRNMALSTVYENPSKETPGLPVTHGVKAWDGSAKANAYFLRIPPSAEIGRKPTLPGGQKNSASLSSYQGDCLNKVKQEEPSGGEKRQCGRALCFVMACCLTSWAGSPRRARPQPAALPLLPGAKPPRFSLQVSG